MLRRTLTDLFLIVLFGLVMGGVMGIGSNWFVDGVSYFASLRANATWADFSLFGTTYSYGSVLFLMGAACLLSVLKKILSLSGWAGAADTIHAAHSKDQIIDVKKGLGSTLAAFICASGGASVGQYGPLVHFGATIGTLFKRLFISRFEVDVLIGCGVAAAISAGFNAPIAGVIFAHEVILRHFSLRALAPISITAISANSFEQLYFPRSVHTFELTHTVPPLTEFVPLLLIAAPLLALTAVAFMASIRISAKFADAYPFSKTDLPFIAAFICGSVGMFYPQILGIGVSTMNDFISGEYLLGMATILLIAKLTMSALCIGFGLFGGVFSPALFLGVAVGSVISLTLGQLGFQDISQVVIVASMAAVGAAVIGAPLSLVIIVLEFTGSYEYAVASMSTIVVTNFITRRFFALSLFDRQLIERGIDMTMGRERIARTQTLVVVCDRISFVRVSEACSGHEALTSMREARQSECYAVDSDGFLVGKLSVFDAQDSGAESIAGNIDRNPLIFSTSDSLEAAMSAVRGFVGEGIPLLDANTKKIIGVISEGSLMHAALKVQELTQRMERD